MFENLLCARAGAVIFVTIEHSQILHAVKNSALDELCEALFGLQHDGVVRMVTGR